LKGQEKRKTEGLLYPIPGGADAQDKKEEGAWEKGGWRGEAVVC